jgi:hypothetical protein
MLHCHRPTYLPFWVGHSPPVLQQGEVAFPIKHAAFGQHTQTMHADLQQPNVCSSSLNIRLYILLLRNVD